VLRARLAPAMISTPGQRVLRRRQRRALPAWFACGRAAPLDRDDRPPLPPAPAAPEPPFEVEYLGRGAQPGPEERLPRQQRDVMAGGAVHLVEVEVTRSKILDRAA
jgi:hypothetical protein